MIKIEIFLTDHYDHYSKYIFNFFSEIVSEKLRWIFGDLINRAKNDRLKYKLEHNCKKREAQT